MKSNRRKSYRRSNKSEPFFSSMETEVQGKEQSFFAPELEIDPVNSPAEKEADAVAKDVVQAPVKKLNQQIQNKRIQRMAEEETAAKRIQKQAEEETAAKRIQKQAEEETAAKRIQRMSEEEPAAKRIQRVEAEEGVDAKRIQRKEKEQQGQHSSYGDINRLIDLAKGKGNPLPEDIRLEMEQKFGADFSRVRIHTDAQAIEMAQKLEAHAFAHGYDIFFNEGRFNPHSGAGKELLAHELTHVVQQKGRI